MSTITQLTTVPADLIGVQVLQPAKPAQPERKPAAAAGKTDADADPDVRLLIQPATQAGLYIYTIIDRASGQVMTQIPHEDVKKLAANPDYEAGQVIDTRV
ncbi:MAG TPA: hypothetical protein VGM25_16290 [Caulobacteraceae bacterium]|jgi:hypothetical protein